jgi:hypothetical protein
MTTAETADAEESRRETLAKDTERSEPGQKDARDPHA